MKSIFLIASSFFSSYMIWKIEFKFRGLQLIYYRKIIFLISGMILLEGLIYIYIYIGFKGLIIGKQTST